MKKTGIISGILIALVILGGVAWWLVAKPGSPTQTNSDAINTEKTYVAKDACTVLTQAIANQILGDGAEIGVGNNNVAGDDVNVSTCTYNAKTDGTIAGVKNMKLATLMIRSPLSEVGVASNEQPFDPPKAGAQAVTGYGEKAFWDPEFGQLNVYKNGTWLIFSYGKSGATERTLDETKLFADKIIPNVN